MKPKELKRFLIDKSHEDHAFRDRLLNSPKTTIEQELDVELPENHQVRVHEDSYTLTHIVLPPRDKYTEAEREEAKKGAGSLEFLRKTLHDPAPPIRSFEKSDVKTGHQFSTPQSQVTAGRDSIQRGLVYLNSAVDSNGAWNCVRFNVAKPEVPRHFERPPFISAFCALALACSNEKLAQSIYQRTKHYIADTIEYPGMWRYYRHLPNDLDSTSLCSLVLNSHPWILLRRNVPKMVANQDESGLFLTWIHAENEPEVVSPFRIEADPVVNANLIAYLGDCLETKKAQAWLERSITDGSAIGASKWYPDPATLYYAISRAMVCVPTSFDQLRPVLTKRILELRDESGRFENVLQTAQAVSSLYNIESLKEIDVSLQLETIIGMQRDDGSWPEILAFGDQSLNWGTFGQIGHASESITGAFCVEALERLVGYLG
ncbi:MAG: hypothetical protein OXG05_11950 [Gammaproteobacteria bacterium]|nr:hypothetical protein [Gammaproteobacteria bacterium]